MVRLTLRGEKLWQRLAPIAAAGQRRILAVLAPADREKLLDLLVQVIEGNRAMARPGTGRRKRRVNGKPSGGNDAAHATRSV
jgi:hypothetical protein